MHNGRYRNLVIDNFPHILNTDIPRLFLFHWFFCLYT